MARAHARSSAHVCEPWLGQARTLLVKVIGLMLVLGSGLPLGKEGPFVHISCCVVKYIPHRARTLDQQQSPCTGLRQAFATHAVGPWRGQLAAYLPLLRPAARLQAATPAGMHSHST